MTHFVPSVGGAIKTFKLSLSTMREELESDEYEDATFHREIGCPILSPIFRVTD